MFGWKKDRDDQGRIDLDATPWAVGKERSPARPLEPRVDRTLTGPRPLPNAVPPRIPDIAGPVARRTEPQPPANDSKRLIVGRDIVLTGEIKACDHLVVEGCVEAALSDIRRVEITPSGRLKGAAQVDTADIAGSYEGDLTVQQKLRIRGTGQVHGQIRYGSIEIERGGRIGGQVEALANEAAPRGGAEAQTPPQHGRTGVDEIEDETEDAE